MKAKIVIFISALVIFLAVIVFLSISFLQKPQPDSVSTQCAFACESGQRNAFCSVEMTLSNGAATCEQLASQSQYSSYDVKPCPAISCTVSAPGAANAADQTCLTGLGGTWQTPISGSCPQSGIKIIKQVNASDQPPITGQICCR